MSYLTGDRGTSANGTKLGSLASTAREDVNNLINKIEREKFQFVGNKYRYEQYKEDEQIKDLTKQAIAAIGTENESAGNMPSLWYGWQYKALQFLW